MQYVFLIILFFLPLDAHQLKENYLHITYNEHNRTLLLDLEVETRLIENNSFIDDNENGIISFKELRAHQEYITAYTNRHFHLYYEQKPLSLHDAIVLFHRYQDQTYMQVTKSFLDIDLDLLSLKYDMFFDLEDTHKLLIHLDDNRGDYILNTENKKYEFSSFRISQLQRLTIFVESGIAHILDGLDHLLFVLMLLIPSVVVLHAHHSAKVIKDSLIAVLKIITTFSFAHSLTLFISGAGLWTPNITFVESSIALSILVVATMNFIAKYKHVNKKIVFVFGLLHGFGFANVLEIAKIDNTLAFIVALFGFNLGVEIGQIFVILLLLPILYIISKIKYTIIVVKLISLFAMIVSSYWFLQRVGYVRSLTF